MPSIWSGVSSTSCSASAMWSLGEVALLATLVDEQADLVDAQLGGLGRLVALVRGGHVAVLTFLGVFVHGDGAESLAQLRRTASSLRSSSPCLPVSSLFIVTLSLRDEPAHLRLLQPQEQLLHDGGREPLPAARGRSTSATGLRTVAAGRLGLADRAGYSLRSVAANRALPRRKRWRASRPSRRSSRRCRARPRGPLSGLRQTAGQEADLELVGAAMSDALLGRRTRTCSPDAAAAACRSRPCGLPRLSLAAEQDSARSPRESCSLSATYRSSSSRSIGVAASREASLSRANARARPSGLSRS